MTDKRTQLVELARRVIQQWDNHDRYRDFDRWGEPTEVKLARGYLELAELQRLRDRQKDPWEDVYDI